MTKWISIAVLGGLLTAGPAAAQDWRAMRQTAEDAVRASLVDPQSAQFQWPYGFVQGTWKPFLGKRIEGTWTCGSVNAKNRMGGYVGQSTFVVVVKDGAAVFVDMDSGGRAGLVSEQCEKSKIWLPAPQEGMLEGSKSETGPARVSIADELAKLVALREKGVLTPAEFEAQKAKLLAQ